MLRFQSHRVLAIIHLQLQTLRKLQVQSRAHLAQVTIHSLQPSEVQFHVLQLIAQFVRVSVHQWLAIVLVLFAQVLLLVQQVPVHRVL